MLEVTKKHRTSNSTDSVVLRFVGPRDRKREAVALLKTIGFSESADAVPWRESFPEFTDEQLPGTSLYGARVKEGLTQREVALLTGIPQRHLSEMENHKRPIGKDTAKKLSEALNVNYKIFL